MKRTTKPAVDVAKVTQDRNALLAQFVREAFEAKIPASVLPSMLRDVVSLDSARKAIREYQRGTRPANGADWRNVVESVNRSIELNHRRLPLTR